MAARRGVLTALRRTLLHAHAVGALGLFAGLVEAQPLPKIELQPAFPELNLKLPVWLEEVPDGSGRIVILEQDGRILIVRKDSDGKDAKEFLNIVNRKPHVELEEGLLGLAFHPQFKTNRLFYIYYHQQNPRRSIFSEFKTLADDPDRADTKSERILMEVPQPFQLMLA